MKLLVYAKVLGKLGNDENNMAKQHEFFICTCKYVM